MRLLFLVISIALFGADYDCIFIGTSPISLFEALYQEASGKSVLILDEACCCGGVWRSIEVCGVPYADIGCHEIGNNKDLKQFLEVYGGCKMIDESNHTFYFSEGCHELIRNLEQRIQNSTARLLLNCRAERVRFSPSEQIATVETKEGIVTAKKIYTCSYSYFALEDEAPRELKKSKYYHLYLLIADPTEHRFTYKGHGVSNTSRLMNLTPYVNLTGTGRQLIVLQTHNQDNLARGETFLAELKEKKLIDPSAYLLQSEPYIYEQYPSKGIRVPADCKPLFEQLNTFDFRGILQHTSRWKGALRPFSEAVSG